MYIKIYQPNCKLIKGEKMKLSSESGQTLVEYALLLALIAIILVAIVTLTGQNLDNKYSSIVNKVP